MPWKRTVDAAALHASSAGATRTPAAFDVLAAQRRERARIRSEKGVRWAGRSLAAAPELPVLPGGHALRWDACPSTPCGISTTSWPTTTT